MKTKEDMIQRYEELYMDMVNSHNPKKMMVFGEAEKWVFKDLVKVHPEMADAWLDHLEAICWNNYLSEKEALNISKKIVNQDGSKGFHWDYNTFISVVEKLGGKSEEKPYYNSYALWATANMIYSDHANSITLDMGYNTIQEVPAEKMAMSCYRKAIEKLKDVDRPNFVRVYFKDTIYGEYTM